MDPFWSIKHVWLSFWLISTFCWATSRLTNNPLTCCSKCWQVSERCNGELMNSFEKFNYIIGYLVPKLYAEGVSVAVPGSDAIGECMGSLAAWCKTVTTENDPAQFKYTAVLIPTLPLLNQADLITPFEELNTCLSMWTAFCSTEEGQFLCFFCQAVIKDAKDSSKCSTCKDERICEKCALEGSAQSSQHAGLAHLLRRQTIRVSLLEPLRRPARNLAIQGLEGSKQIFCEVWTC